MAPAWKGVITRRYDNSVQYSAGDENGPSGDPAPSSATNKTWIDGRRCCWRWVSLCQHVQVDAERRGGWTQILGSEASESGDLSTDRKTQFYLPQVYLALSLGMISFEYQRDIWLQKTIVPGLSWGVLCVILWVVVLTQYRRVTDGRTDGHMTTANTRAGISCPENAKDLKFLIAN